MPKTPLDHLDAEVKSKLDPTRSAVEVPLADRQVFVKPVMKWKASGLRALRESDMDTWAEKCLDQGSYSVWQEVDPDLEQCEAFFEAWTAATGDSRPS